MRQLLKAYGIAIVAIGVAVLVRWLLDPLLGDSLPLVTLFGAVAVAAWTGGYPPAVLVAVVGYVACAYLFIDPRGALGLDRVINVVGLIAYAFTCLFIILIGEAMRRARSAAAERGELLRVTLNSIGDAVITTDVEGRITYVNAVAEALTGWLHADALTRPLASVFRIVDEQGREPAENPATRALREGFVVGLANHTVLIAKDGSERTIDDSAAPIRDEQGNVSGCVLIFRDVSEKRRLEKQAASRLVDARMLASIVESSDDAIVSKSLEGIIQSWNAAAERVFGYTAEQAVGRHISIVIPPERITEEDGIIATLRAGRRVDHFVTERVRSDGRRILVSLTISPVKDEAGNVIGASKIVRDVTSQHESEERERRLLADAVAANAKFRALFDQGALFAAILDVDGTIVEPSRTAVEGCGYTRAQVIGKRFWEGPWWTPSTSLAERIRTATADAAQGKTIRDEMPFLAADGHARTVDITILPVKDDTGRILFLAATGTDITDRKLADAERDKFVTLVESSTDFIGICDLQGVPVYVNPAGLDLVGLDGMDEARRVNVRDFFFPEDQSSVMDEFFAAVMASGHGEMDVRFRNFKTADARWMAYKVLKLTDSAGEAIAYATVSQDVTERRQLEDDLRTLAADLSEVDRRKNEFLATLSHELRNPLAPLRNMLEVLQRADGDRETVGRAVDTMERQLGQLVRLVDDLLDLNRITHDRIDLRKARVDVGSVIRDVVQAARPMTEAMGHDVQVSVPAEPIYVHADAVRLTQVFGNLLSNSSKYTPGGGAIRVTARRHENVAEIAFADTGIGIAPDQLERIFDMFVQADRTIEGSQGGLGIGLTLANRLVHLHGGSIEAKSAGLGRGSEFVVRLPIVAEHADDDTKAPAATPHTHRTYRVLVVDDNRDAASSLELLLQLAGHETSRAHDGPGALAAAEKERPELILLDIGLPTLNGYEVCRRIRAQPWGASVVMIALTGWGQDEDRRRSHEAGFDGHLVKPVEYAELMALLDRVQQ
ncbi:MAG TPA: PAS domain S-box protein [Casimicrobiaceae bacterium]|nr:PAS domain S-box protein [Casimicrobiaceae bacterium]